MDWDGLVPWDPAVLGPAEHPGADPHYSQGEELNSFRHCWAAPWLTLLPGMGLFPHGSGVCVSSGCSWQGAVVCCGQAVQPAVPLPWEEGRGPSRGSTQLDAAAGQRCEIFHQGNDKQIAADY